MASFIDKITNRFKLQSTRTVNHTSSNVRKPRRIDDTPSVGEISQSDRDVAQIIQQARERTTVREYRYAEYDLLEGDPITKVALDKYADDATQKSDILGSMFVVTSEDPVLARDLTSLFHRLNIDSRAWTMARNLAKYGNHYMKVIMSPDRKDIEKLQDIDSPGSVLDLYYLGDPVFYLKTDDVTLNFHNEYELYDRNSFLHFYVHSGSFNESIRIPCAGRDYNKDGEHTDDYLEFITREGESLVETVRVLNKVIQLRENSMLAAVIAKSDFARLISVETGDLGNIDTRKLLSKVRSLFEEKKSIDTRGEGSYDSHSKNLGYASNIFNTTSNGKGAISIQNYGGDFEVRSLVDLDYFMRQKFAALRIPPQMFGFNLDGAPDYDNSKSLRQSVEYSRLISKICDAMIDGLSELANIWLSIRGRKNQIGKFKIVMSNPSSTEELSRLEEVSTRVQIITDLANTITSTLDEGINKSQLLTLLINEYIPHENLSRKLTPILREAQDLESIKVDTSKIEARNNLEQVIDQIGGESPIDDMSDFTQDSQDSLASQDYEDSSDFGVPSSGYEIEPQSGGGEILWDRNQDMTVDDSQPGGIIQ